MLAHCRIKVVAGEMSGTSVDANVEYILGASRLAVSLTCMLQGDSLDAQSAVWEKCEQ